jgi:hypothetical protein
MSFAFQATDQEWDADRRNRRILAANIHRGDVSVVNQGANEATSASVRAGASLDERRRLTDQLGRNVVVQTRGAFMVGLHAPSMDQRAALVRSAQFGMYVPRHNGAVIAAPGARVIGDLARRSRSEHSSTRFLRARADVAWVVGVILSASRSARTFEAPNGALVNGRRCMRRPLDSIPPSQWGQQSWIGIPPRRWARDGPLSGFHLRPR